MLSLVSDSSMNSKSERFLAWRLKPYLGVVDRLIGIKKNDIM